MTRKTRVFESALVWTGPKFTTNALRLFSRHLFPTFFIGICFSNQALELIPVADSFHILTLYKGRIQSSLDGPLLKVEFICNVRVEPSRLPAGIFRKKRPRKLSETCNT